MVDDILTAEEIEALLGEMPDRRLSPGAGASRLVQDYDLTRPTRMGHSQVERVSRLQGAVAGPLGERLSRVLDLPVQADLAAVEQLRVDAFLRSLAGRAPVFGVGDEDTGVTGLLTVDPTFLCGAIDRMLGGRGDSEPAARELTPTELALTEKLIEPVLLTLSEAWAEVRPIRLTILSRPGEPRPGDDLDGESPVLSTTFLLGGPGPAGSIRYCLATPRIEHHLAGGGAKKLIGAPAAAIDPRVERGVRQVGIPLTAILGHARVPLRELAEISPGDVIPLDRRVDEPLDLACGIRTKFRGYAGRRRGRFAVTITSRVDRGARPEAERA